MCQIKGTCSTEVAEKLAAQGPIRANVLGRPAIVTATVREPITLTADASESGEYARAHDIPPHEDHVEADLTPEADAQTQQLIDQVHWAAWPPEAAPPSAAGPAVSTHA